MNSYDLVVIGAGPGGYVAAIRAAQLGKTVAVIEAREVGGTCLNRGCIPTKTLLHTAGLLRETTHFAELGLSIGEVQVDMPRLIARKNAVSEQLRGGIEQLFKGNKITLINGRAVIIGKHQITVTHAAGIEVIEGDRILIAVGSIPAQPPIAGSDLPGVIDSDTLLDKDSLYKRLVIIGGGVIGVEFATVFAALGCEVTIIEALDRVLANMDKEISQNLSMLLKKDGVKIFTGAKVVSITKDNDGLCVNFVQKETEQAVQADGVLIAVGRSAHTADLFGDGFSLPMERGKILVNEHFQTAEDNIYAIGDCIPGIQLAHMASAQGMYVAEHICGHHCGTDLALVPSCVYTDPEIATVGMTADDAKAAGRAVQTGKYVMTGNGKSIIEQQKRGFIKLVFDEETKALLGAQLMCARATDLIGEMTTAIVNKLTAEQLAATIRAHPTFGEGIGEALEEAINGCSIHTMPKRR